MEWFRLETINIEKNSRGKLENIGKPLKSTTSEFERGFALKTKYLSTKKSIRLKNINRFRYHPISIAQVHHKIYATRAHTHTLGP